MGGHARVRATAVCIAALVAGLGVAGAGDGKTVAAKQKEAARLVADGDYGRALEVIDEALALDPGRLALLQLRAATLLEMRDFEGALAAYEKFLAAGPKGANRRAAAQIVENLAAVRTTSIEVAITGATADDPANVYLDSRSLGVFCVATPRCTRGLPPGDYKVIVERAGHAKLTERVSIALDQRFVLDRAMTELSSSLSVAVAGEPAALTLDGADVGATPLAVTVDAGDHVLDVRRDGFATEHVTFAAHRGEPVALEIALRRLVPITVDVPGAEVLLGDAPAPREEGALALPAGALTLTVRAPGYLAATIDVPAARPDDFRLDVTLTPAPAPLTVEGAPRGAVITVDGRVVGKAPLSAPIEVEQGSHTIAVTASGRAPLTTRVELASDAPMRLEITRMPSTRRTWTYVTAATTGAALASWAAFGALTLARKSAYDERAREPGVTPMDPTLRSLSDAGNTFAVISDVSLGVGLVAAGAATWLFLVEGKGESAGRVTPLVGTNGVGVQGSF